MEIITEVENVYKKYAHCRKEDILTSHGSFTKECDPTYSHSGLSKGTNQTNKHTDFKEIRGLGCGNDNYKLLCLAINKEDIMTPHGPLTRECDPS